MKLAKDFATAKHGSQTRRDGTPYIAHPERVAGHVRRVKGHSSRIDDIESAAWLHDTLEDTETSYEEIEQHYGKDVAGMVKELTSDKEEIERIGKTVYLQQKLRGMSNYSLIIKLADRLDNVSDLMTTDNREWAIKYAVQTQDILEYLLDNRELTNPQLRLVDEINDLVDEVLATTDKANKSDVLEEKYDRAANASSLKRDLLSSKKILQEELDAESLLHKLNKIGYPYDVSFSDEEQYGHEWSHGDVSIQLGYILEDGSIVIVCDPANLIEYVLYDDNLFPYFVRIVTSVVNHELVHRDQLSNTPFDYQVTRRDLQNSESNYKYLSNTKEIDAHAAEAVSEFLEMGYSVKEIRGWLTSTEKIKDHASEANAFWKYWSNYGSYHDEDDEVWKRFLSRFYDFLQKESYIPTTIE